MQVLWGIPAYRWRGAPGFGEVHGATLGEWSHASQSQHPEKITTLPSSWLAKNWQRADPGLLWSYSKTPLCHCIGHDIPPASANDIG
jgi:hypothetical protein